MKHQTVSQVASSIGRHPTFVWGAIKKGHLKATKGKTAAGKKGFLITQRAITSWIKFNPGVVNKKKPLKRWKTTGGKKKPEAPDLGSGIVQAIRDEVRKALIEILLPGEVR